MLALHRWESVGFAFLRSDEWLDEVGGCLYLQLGDALGVGEESIVVLACADVAETVGYACEIRLRFYR